MRTERFKIGILALCFTLSGILASTVDAQSYERCGNLVDLVYEQITSADVSQEDMLITVITNARAARDCYGTGRPEKIAWLLNQEVYALDLLNRQEEAWPLVDLFFQDYFDDALDGIKGQFYMWRVLFRLYDGDYSRASVEYDSALKYNNDLLPAQQAGLRNNGFVLEFRRERFEEAEREATVGIALLDSTFQTRDEAVELAKLLQNRGHARLATFENGNTSPLLDPARRDLHAAIALRDSLLITERQAEAYVSLGEIYHGLGDGQAGRGYMGTGLRLAREGGNPRGEIFALWRTGRMSRRGGLSSLARQQLRQALNLSQESGVGEFKLFIELELARLFEDRQAWRRAEILYRAVVETPDDARYRSRLFDDAKARDEAERRRVAMRMHLAEEQASWLRLALLGLALLLLLGSGAALTQRRRFVRLRNRYAVLRNGTPEEDNLFDRRRRYAYRVLERPAEVAVVLGETDLSVLLVAGLADRTQLYACVCAMEETLEDRVIDPENMRRYLHHHFTKKGWDWPESLDTWKEHFQEQPI